MFEPVDWGHLLLPSIPLLELVVRGTVIYLAIFVLLRVTPQRQASGVNITDIIVVVLIADAASPGLAGQEAETIGDGLTLVVTVLFWNYVLNRLEQDWPAFGRFVHPPAVMLIKDGVLQRRAMRREMVTEDELLTQLRSNGLERFEQVKRAQLEGDGRISVVPKPGEG